jgi:hypothetical protein
MARGITAEARAKMSAGGKRGVAYQRAAAAEGLAFARKWRESRRCPDCGALAYVGCTHRPNGFEDLKRPAANGCGVGADQSAGRSGSHAEAIARSHGEGF